VGVDVAQCGRSVEGADFSGYVSGGAAGCDRVNCDAAFDQLGPQIEPYRRDGSLAGRIQGVLVDADARADRGRKQDPPAAPHCRRGGLGGEQLPGDIDVKDPVEVGQDNRFQCTEVLDAALLARNGSRSLCANLDNAALLPLVDRRQPTQFDQKRCRAIDVLSLTFQPSLVRPSLRFANLFARFGSRVDIRHGRTVRRGRLAPLPPPTTSTRPPLSTSPVSQFVCPPTQPNPHH
jgi:hypothetical protein